MKMIDCPVSVRHTAKFTDNCGLGDDEWISKTEIFKSEKDHNKAVQKKMKQIWILPKVYGGMNT